MSLKSLIVIIDLLCLKINVGSGQFSPITLHVISQIYTFFSTLLVGKFECVNFWSNLTSLVLFVSLILQLLKRFFDALNDFVE